MPGYTLNLRCPCGFRKKDVWVGVTEDYLHLTFGICLDCKKIFALQCKPGGKLPTTCHQCGMKLLTPDAPGAWEPAELQQKFPATEPWLVESEFHRLPEKEAKTYCLIEDIRLLCPKCGKYALNYKEDTLWD
jgi:hypothetical protein